VRSFTTFTLSGSTNNKADPFLGGGIEPLCPSCSPMGSDPPGRGGGIEILCSGLRDDKPSLPTGFGGGILGLAPRSVVSLKEMGVELLWLVPVFAIDSPAALSRAGAASDDWGIGASCIRMTDWGGPVDAPEFGPGFPARGLLMSGPTFGGGLGGGGWANGEPLPAGGGVAAGRGDSGGLL
jgi:hypothetical protein